MGKVKVRPLSEEDMSYIRDNYGKFTVKELAEKFNTTLGSMTHTIHRNGIKRTTKYKHKDPQHAGFKAKFRHYKSAATTRKLEFLLEIEEFKEITSKNCFYCDSAPRPTSPCAFPSSGKLSDEFRKNSIIKFNGIDRIDSSKGYIKGNCVTCCTTCNIMKSDLTAEEFKAHIEQIFKHYVKK